MSILPRRLSAVILSATLAALIVMLAGTDRLSADVRLGVINETDATLVVSVSSVYSGWIVTDLVVPPRSVAALPAYRASIFTVSATARCVAGDPMARQEIVAFDGRSYDATFFPRDFGKSVMLDGPGCELTPQRAEPVPQDAASCDFPGRWSTSWTRGAAGSTVLTINEDLGGDYDWRSGEISAGRLTGAGVLEGSWSQDNGGGTFRLEMQPDCQSFLGTWADTANGRTGTWDGNRLD